MESTISTLRASLRSAIAEGPSRSRYQLRAPSHSAAIGIPEERISNIAGEKEHSLAPSKLVAHADPNWISDVYELKPSQSAVNNPKEVREESSQQEQAAGESSATKNPTREEDGINKSSDVVSGSRPAWVNDGTLCIVCHNPFGPEGAHILGTCGHVFHPPCLVDYSKVKRHCFCDVAIDTRYYASVCLQESMPPELRNCDGRSSLHGGFDWEINIDR